MILAIVLALYLVFGAWFGVLVARRRRGSWRWDSLLSLLAWPLWVPIALAPDAPNAHADSEVVTRIERSLSGAADGAEGTPLAGLLTREATDQILAQARRIDGRLRELTALLARPELCAHAARRRVSQTEGERGPHAQGQRPSSARVHLDNIERLTALKERDARTLEELADLAEAIRSQLLVARMAGFSGDGIGAIVNDLWARIEGLDEAMASHAL